MDLHDELASWLRRMGYDGQIPESMISICNNSTSFIWEQLMQNIKPKQEVEHIQKNIVFNRLKAKSLGRQDEFIYQMKIMENFKKKQEYQEKLKLLKEQVQEKQFKVDKLGQNCKIQGVTIEHIKKKLKENEERLYLLDLKKDDLQKKCLDAEQTLKDIKNVTPIEMDDSVGSQDKIMETLEKCAEKLQGIINKNVLSSSTNIPQKSFVRMATSVKKKPFNTSSIASFLDKTEKQNFEQICSVKKSKVNEKENLPSNEQVHKVKKALFLQPSDIRIDSVGVTTLKTICYDKVVKVTGNVAKIDIEISEHLEVEENETEQAKPKKRESLGLLPEGCLSDFDENDFLQPNSLQKLETFYESEESFLSMINSNVTKTESDSDSVVMNIKPAINKNEKIKDAKLRESLYNNPVISNILERLLHSNNRQTIYNTLQNLFEKLNVELTKMISTGGSIEERRKKISEEDITRLLFIHVQTELDILNQKKVIKDLLVKIANAKMHILSVGLQTKSEKEVQEVLNQKIKQVGLEVSIASIKKEIDNTKLKEENKELQLTTLKIAKAKDDIANKISQIQSYLDEIYKVQKQLVTTREEALGPVWNLRLCKNDDTWSQPLAEGLWSQEMKVFEKFPLEFNRRCSFTDPKTFYRDLCVDNFPQHTSINPEELQMMNEILESPFSPPETVLLNLMKSKMMLEALKSLRNGRRTSSQGQYKTYTFAELEHQESYLNFAIEKLQSVMYSKTAGETLGIVDVIKKTMEIWAEMPMKEFISSNRLHEVKIFYQDQLKMRALNKIKKQMRK